MPHFLSFFAGRAAREVVKSVSKEMGASKETAHFLGVVTQLAVGIGVGIATADLGGKAATLGDIHFGAHHDSASGLTTLDNGDQIENAYISSNYQASSSLSQHNAGGGEDITSWS